MKKDETIQEQQQVSEEHEMVSRREYLLSLKKWSKVVIGGVLFSGILAGTSNNAEAGWANSRGGWGNGGGGGWINNRGGGGAWVNGGGGWANRGGGSWGNGGGGWVNRW